MCRLTKDVAIKYHDLLVGKIILLRAYDRTVSLRLLHLSNISIVFSSLINLS